MELHLEVKVIGKGAKGRTACGSSAYRACDQIIDNAGEIHDYRRKGGHVSGGVELPANASEELRDRQTLWRRHEEKDRRKDAELFREVVVALPNELSRSGAERVIKGIAAEATKLGMCVQWDIHDVSRFEDLNGKHVAKKNLKKGFEYKEIRNLHGHLMLSMRELSEDGRSFGKKNRSWNKYNGGLNLPELLRPVAAKLMNEELSAIGADKVVEHEKYADRGIDKIPQQHVGVAATAMERRGVATNKGDRNRYIDWLNQIHAENLRQVETQLKNRSLQDLIDQAERLRLGKVTSDEEVFKGWEALFAMVRDTRRCRAAMRNELSKIEKVASAFENGDHAYLRWAGCDPFNEIIPLDLRARKDSLHSKIKQMDSLEILLLDCKQLMKRRNDVIYTSKKVAWDEYQLERNKRGMAACARRLKSLDQYMSYLRKSVSLLDVIFQTKEWHEYQCNMLNLEHKRRQLQKQHLALKESIVQGQTDLKQHKQEQKQAKKDMKAFKKSSKSSSGFDDLDNR